MSGHDHSDLHGHKEDWGDYVDHFMSFHYLPPEELKFDFTLQDAVGYPDKVVQLCFKHKAVSRVLLLYALTESVCVATGWCCRSSFGRGMWDWRYDVSTGKGV